MLDVDPWPKPLMAKKQKELRLRESENARQRERETYTHTKTERNREKSSAKRGDEAREPRRHLHCPTGLPDGQQEPRPAGLIQYVFEVPNYF